jgi:8-oxo-dGTP pyrophosphatase MutT (NUDIX family)
MAGPDRDDAPFDPQDPTRPGRAPRPRDAATLILIRRDGAAPRVLMGRRSRGHDFMPDKYVFPGGRVDRADSLGPAASELDPATAADLAKAGARRASRAFALAAVREMWEEAGLIVGARTPAAGAVRGAWRAFARSGALPHLAPLQFVARAITPPYRPKRFDARFFMADAEACLLDERPARDGAELQDLRWFALEEALTLDLPNVTRFVLGEIAERLAARGEPVGSPFLRWTRKGHRMDRL